MENSNEVDLGAFAVATAGLGESVKLRADGRKVVAIGRSRNADGDLQVDLALELAAAAAEDPAGTDGDEECAANTSASDPSDPSNPIDLSIDHTTEEPL